MSAVFRYENGVLSLRDEKNHYFSLDLGGRVELDRVWSSVEVRRARMEGMNFLIDYLKQRKVEKVEYDKKIWVSDFWSFKNYMVVIVYEDCKVCIDFDELKYKRIMVLGESFIMIFSKSKFLFKLRVDRKNCVVVDLGRVADDYLERLVMEFSDGMFDIKAKCRFELNKDSLKIDVNDSWLFSVELYKVKYSGKEFIYYDVWEVGGEENLYRFMWDLYEKNIDNLNYTVLVSEHYLEIGNFMVRYKKGEIDFLYRYYGDRFYFEVELDSWPGRANVIAKFKDGFIFRCVFYKGMDMFNELVRADGRIERYIKGVSF